MTNSLDRFPHHSSAIIGVKWPFSPGSYFTILTLTLTHNPNPNPNRYLTIKEAQKLPGVADSYNLFVATPNEEIRKSLKLEMSTFLIGNISEEMLQSYGRKLQQLDFDSAADCLEQSFRSKQM